MTLSWGYLMVARRKEKLNKMYQLQLLPEMQMHRSAELCVAMLKSKCQLICAQSYLVLYFIITNAGTKSSAESCTYPEGP